MKTLSLKQFLLFALAASFICNHATAQIFTNLCNLNLDGNSHSSLVLSGNTLYGTLNIGGTKFGGTVFAINTDGTGYTNLYNFSFNETSPYTNSDGEGPYAGLLLSSNTLYGTTGAGGIFGIGTIFKINTDGTGFTNLYDFSATSTNSSGTYTNSDGAAPEAGLILCEDTLYGTTESGGTNGLGTIFKIDIDGTDFTNLYSFTGGSDGANPVAGLILSGNMLYGTAVEGGVSNAGVVFAINTDGMGFTNLYDFTGGSDGARPIASLILSGNTLYGTTDEGGNGYGAIFAIKTNGIGFTNFYSFTGGSDGANPAAGLILSGNIFYGTAMQGGSGSDGTIFAIHTDGTGFMTLHSIYPYFVEGYEPLANLVLSNNTLYGTTSEGGADDGGTVFALSLGSIPLNVQNNGSNQTITWGNPAFSLQTASALTGPWTTLTNAASPYTINATNAQAFFQLVYSNSP